MWHRFSRLFTIKTRWEACLIIYALATGAMERGKLYLVHYPGFGGWLLFAACSGSVFLAGAKIFDALRYAPQPPAPAPRRSRAERREQRRYARQEAAALPDQQPASIQV